MVPGLGERGGGISGGNEMVEVGVITGALMCLLSKQRESGAPLVRK